jgi:hypothetical protein
LASLAILLLVTMGCCVFDGHHGDAARDLCGGMAAVAVTAAPVLVLTIDSARDAVSPTFASVAFPGVDPPPKSLVVS